MKSTKKIGQSLLLAVAGLAFLVLLVIGSACDFRGEPGSTTEIRNVVLISIDTCRADRLGCYGFNENITPQIDQVAREGVLFTRAHSTNSLTLPAHCSMLTGTYPPYHGVHGNNSNRLGPSNVTLAEVLQDRGFRTAAFVSALPMESKYGLDQGFQTYDDKFSSNPRELSGNERKATEVNRAAFAWLDNHGPEPFFLLLHYYDPHQPYAAPEAFAARYPANPYLAEIAYTDTCIGQVIEKLKSMGRYDSTLLIITSDHGESLGEHDENSHGYFVYQSTIRVPLIVKAPGGAVDTTFDAPVGIVDIPPTVLAMLGVSAPPQIQGEDLSDRIYDQGKRDDDRYLYCESFVPTMYTCNPLRGLVYKTWKYIWTTEPELYDLAQDPAETDNLFAREPEVAEELQRRLQEMLSAHTRTIIDDHDLKQDSDSARRLETLGYVGSRRVTTSLELDPDAADAKDFIEFYKKLMKAYRLYHVRDFDQANLACLEIVEQQPTIFEAYMLLGDISMDTRRYADAVAHYSKYLLGAGKLRDPTGQTAVPLDFDISRVQVRLGNALASRGKIDEAIAYFRQAHKLDPQSPKARANLGIGLASRGKLQEGIHHLRQVIEAGEEMPDVHFNLGLALTQQENHDEALTHYRRAVELNSTDAKAQYQLAVALSGQGRDDEARKHLMLAGRLNPRNIAHMNNRAWNKAANPDAGARDPKNAIFFVEVAAELSGYQNATVLDTLAVAYAADGQFDRAVSAAEKAVQAATDAGEESVAESIGQRLKLYQQSQPFFASPEKAGTR